MLIPPPQRDRANLLIVPIFNVPPKLTQSVLVQFSSAAERLAVCVKRTVLNTGFSSFCSVPLPLVQESCDSLRRVAST